MMDDEMETDPLHLKYKPMKVCGICGDKALGYNFNAITCEACKAFFRRNALRNKDFKCPFDGNCKIDLVTRRFCQKCRLKKCFDIGMKKEWILSDDEKKVKRDKILENRRKKDVTGSDYSHHSNSCDNSMSGIKSPSSINGDLLNSNYHMSGYQENKDLLNSLYLLEHHKYQNLYLSSKLFPNKGTFSKDYANAYSNSLPGKSLYSPESFNSKSEPSSLRAPSSLVNYGHSLWPSAENNLHPKHPNAFTDNHHQFFKPHIKQESLNGHANYPMPYNPEHPFMNLKNNKDELDLIQLGCNRTPNDQASSVISSDESETTTVYSSYNSDNKNIEDISILESPVVPTNLSIDPQSKAFSDNKFAKEPDPNDYTSSDDDHFMAHHASLNNKTHLSTDSKLLNPCVSDAKTEENPANSLDGLFDLGKPRPSLPPLVPPNSYNFIETLRMEEISSACDTMKRWYQGGSVLKEMDNLPEMYQVAELVIKHLITMARMISTFNELCEADQISLLKGSVTEMLILRSIPCYVPEKDAWVFNISETRDVTTLLKFNTYKKTIMNGEFSEDVRHFMLAFPEECKRDIVLFDLLTMMILFTPNRSDLKHSEIIKLEHITYKHLLQKYIDLNYLSSKSSNQVFFTTLIDRVEDLHKINSKITQTYPSKVVDEFKANHFGHL